MSRVLFITPTLPWPQDSGGRIRTSALLQALRDEHEVALWCVAGEGQGRDHEENARALCSSLGVFPRSSGSPLRSLTGPVQESWFASASLRRALAGLSRAEFDLIHVDELCLIRSIPLGLPIPVVQHHHKLDLELCTALRATGPRRTLERERWKLLEIEARRRCPHHVFCCEQDAQIFRSRHPTVVAHVVPNGVNPQFFQPTTQVREEDHILALGSLDYAPNALGLRRFLQLVWPGMRAQRPRLTLSIVGSGKPLFPWGQAPAGVHFEGAVADVRPWLGRVSALVVPLHIGGGSRLKIIEAAAMACPIVSTAAGASGLAFQQDEHLLSSPSIEQLGRSIFDCLRHPKAAQQRAQRAREFALKHHDWVDLGRELGACWSRVLHS